MDVLEAIARALLRDLETRKKPPGSGYPHTPWEGLDDTCQLELLAVASTAVSALDTATPEEAMMASFDITPDAHARTYFRHLLKITKDAKEKHSDPN